MLPLQAPLSTRTIAPSAVDLVNQFDEDTARDILETDNECMNRRFYMSRTFRVGWGPGGVLVCPQVLVRKETDRYPGTGLLVDGLCVGRVPRGRRHSFT